MVQKVDVDEEEKQDLLIVLGEHKILKFKLKTSVDYIIPIGP